MARRTTADQTGATDSLPIRIARKVLPQIRHITAKLT